MSITLSKKLSHSKLALHSNSSFATVSKSGHLISSQTSSKQVSKAEEEVKHQEGYFPQPEVILHLKDKPSCDCYMSISKLLKLKHH